MPNGRDLSRLAPPSSLPNEWDFQMKKALDSSSGKPTSPKEIPVDGPGVKCLRCEGTGQLTRDCDMCSGRGTMVVTCRKCLGKGTYSQKAGPCARCEATGMLADGTKCPRCKGNKVQLAFSSPCTKCSGSGSLNVPCKRCNGSLHFQGNCLTCQGTGIYRR